MQSLSTLGYIKLAVYSAVFAYLWWRVSDFRRRRSGSRGALAVFLGVFFYLFGFYLWFNISTSVL